MAFQTGTSTSIENLLTQLSTFLQANGWTETFFNTITADIGSIGFSKNGIFVSMQYTEATDGGTMALYQATAADPSPTTDPWTATGDSGNGRRDNRPDREGMTIRFANWRINAKEPRLTDRVAFLTDGRAISAAETYLGSSEHYELAQIVGGATAGTNGNVNPIRLPGGYTISWTGMKVLKQDGSRHHGVGILPTIPVSRTIRGVAAGRREGLEGGNGAVRTP